MISVVENRRLLGSFKGEVMRREEFGSWKAAYRYLENDLLMDRGCPEVNIMRRGRNSGCIQHWGMRDEYKTCKCFEKRHRI